MNIHKRIREIAAQKVKVRITKKVRSNTGFYVSFPVVAAGGGVLRTGNHWAKTKREAEQMLLARLRCWEELKFSIQSWDEIHKRASFGGLHGSFIPKEKPRAAIESIRTT